MGLDGEFSIIRTQILATKSIPSLGSAYHLVAEDEQQRAIAGVKRPVNETMAFQTSMKRGGPVESDRLKRNKECHTLRSLWKGWTLMCDQMSLNEQKEQICSKN
ncbi:hypothetical protein Hdeb2414_s0015g00452511 [Helianthus debilis subsp. tardiflorus]